MKAHLLFGLFVALVAGYFVNPLAASFIAYITGVAKVVFDWHYKKDTTPEHFVATVFGAFLGFVFLVIVT
jgi:ABC-type Fe3+-siderophore transport system permease subunit